MEFSETVIELNFDRNHFEEIYFKDRRGSIVLDPSVKSSFLQLCLAIILSSSSIIYTYITDKSGWLIVVFFLFLVFAIINFYLNFTSVIKWRREVSGYIKRISEIRQHTLTLSPNSLSMVEDGNETIVKWSAFSKLFIDQNHLSLWGSENFMFPKKSMSPEEYELLTKITRFKIKENE